MSLEKSTSVGVAVTAGMADVNGAQLYYETAGTGHPLVMIHGGLVDCRLWDDQFEAFARHYRAVRYDVRGHGRSMPTPDEYSDEEDLRALLDYLGIEKAILMGLSNGGRIAINFALGYPGRVTALLPVASGLDGYDSPERQKTREKDQESNDTIEAGDIDKGVELSLRIWTDGPGRAPEQVDPAFRERVRAMTLHLISLPEDGILIRPENPARGRLAEIHVPTLAIVGDEDVRYILEIADLLEAEIPNARQAVIPGTAHHLNMEKPEIFNKIVLDFLGQIIPTA